MESAALAMPPSPPMPRSRAPVIPPGAISRVDRRGMHGWRIYIKRRGQDYTALVHDHQHQGSRQQARRAALALYLEELQRLPPPLRTSTSDVRSKTGVVGVTRERQVLRTGSVYECYRAVWPDRRGGYVKRAFSIKKYGAKVAFRLAQEARRQGLARLAEALRAELDQEVARRVALARKASLPRQG